MLVQLVASRLHGIAGSSTSKIDVNVDVLRPKLFGAALRTSIVTYDYAVGSAI